MELTHEQLAALLKDLELNRDVADVRRSSRTVIRRQVKITLADHHTDAPEVEVVLQDISRGGIRVTHHEGLPQGKRFTLHLSANGKMIPINCTVRHCEMVKQHLFRIGAEFTQ